MSGSGNKIELCVKTVAFQTTHVFNQNQKIKHVIEFAVKDPRFGLEKDPARSYKAWLEGTGPNRELVAEKQIDEQNISPGACILIAAPNNQDG